MRLEKVALNMELKKRIKHQHWQFAKILKWFRNKTWCSALISNADWMWIYKGSIKWAWSRKIKKIYPEVQGQVDWIEEGDKSTKYLFSLEKCNYIRKHIHKLTGGSITTDHEEKLLIEISFYKTLYASKQSQNDNEIAYFITGDVAALNQHFEMSCEGNVTTEECQKALTCYKTNKNQGIMAWQWHVTSPLDLLLLMF